MASEKKKDELVFFVNGKKVVENNVDPETSLLTYLRRKLGLCGTKLGCGEGGCGACTVMISKFDRFQKKIVYPLNQMPWDGKVGLKCKDLQYLEQLLGGWKYGVV